MFKSSRLEVFHEKGVIKKFAKFEKHLCRSHFFNKVAGWKPPMLLQRDPGAGIVMNSPKFSKIHIL